MGLPVPDSLDTETFELFGTPVQIRALTRAEALALRGDGELEVAVAEAKLIAYATDTPYDDVVAWLAKVPAGPINKLTERITEISGMVVEGPFRS